MELIVHICTKDNWDRAQSAGFYKPATYLQDGFIHFSKPDQVLFVANTFYASVDDLLLIWADPTKLSSELIWEKTGDENFPHLYGPLNLEAVVAAADFFPSEDGVFRTLPKV